MGQEDAREDGGGRGPGARVSKGLTGLEEKGGGGRSNSCELMRQPGGMISSGRRGEKERRVGAINREGSDVESGR